MEGNIGLSTGNFEVFYKLPTMIKVPKDSRVLPLGVVALTVTFHILYYRIRRPRKRAPGEILVSSGNDLGSRDWSRNLSSHILHLGGNVVYGYMIAGLVGTSALFGLSVITVRDWSLRTGTPGIHCPEFPLTITYLYASALAFVALLSKQISHLCTRYNTITLLSVFAVYAYRDLYPLATYTKQPADKEEGQILYTKLVLLCLTAVVLPLFTPRIYIPVDAKNPIPMPNPEQTASWISRITFSYIDAVILLGTKVAHLRHDQLPPLCDDDYAEYQTRAAFPHLDPFCGARKRRHLFFGLLRHFRGDYAILGFTLFCSAVCSFAGPIGINQTLRYLETGGEDTSIHPWVWVIFLFAGPLLESMAEHWNLFTETKIRVRVQALLTQLVFEHSLRIRLKAETSDDINSGQRTPTVKNLISEPSESASAAADNASLGGETGEASTVHVEPSQSSTLVISRDESLQGTPEGSVKGKSKDIRTDETLRVPSKKQPADTQNLIGKINNLVTSDLDNIVEGINFLNLVFLVPLQITLCILFLYRILGWSAIVGLFTTIALSPAVGYLGKMVNDVQVLKMKSTDARVQSVSEAVGVLRMIKLFGWENKMSQQLDIRREEELRWLWKIKFLKLSNTLISTFIPALTMLVTFATYTVIMKKELKASTIFSSMAVFGILHDQLHRISWQSTMMIEGKVSLDRISDFLQNTELLDRFASESEDSSISMPRNEPEDSQVIGFRDADFAWSIEDEGAFTALPNRQFRLHIKGELIFKQNGINLIIGPTGCGKTSVLMALLGEMHFIPSSVNSWFNLPRGDGIAYSAQESWVQNATIRENIIFGSPFDEERYQQVIHQCALKRDLELFEAGDKTEVGERGLTLSGGQKARLALARAIYSSAKVILLDDVLSALDVHTSAWIVNHCFRGNLVKGRTILLVTHNVALAGPVADFVVSIGIDGIVHTQGTGIAAAIATDPVLASEVKRDQEILELEMEEEVVPTVESALEGKLVVAEEIVEGHITLKSMKLLFSGLGGNRPIFFFAAWMIGMMISELVFTAQTWFLGTWGSQYEKHAPSEISLPFYLTVLTLIILAKLILFFGVNLYYNYRSVSASRIIHKKLVHSVFGSTLRWLDETPTARIIARCTQDMRTVDGPIPQSLYWVFSECIGMLTKLSVIIFFSPIFLFPGVAVAILGISMGNLYLKAQLSVKREMSNARSPLLAHFNAAIHGLVSIRAYDAQQPFKVESLKRINHYSRTARTSWNLNRWIGFRMDILGASFTSGLAAYLVYGKAVSAANTGLSLNMAVSFCTYIFWLIRIFNELEVQSNSLERIQGYLDIDHESQPTRAGIPPASWPTSGDLRVENLSARYSQSGPIVLHGLSFHIRSGQRIGVVGRTGSGKSSLTLALLRCILTEGTVYYDGLATNTINLDALRANVTIIPQTPELLSGTLRQNLDPFDQNDDGLLNDTLRDSGLFSLQEEAGQARLTLDSKISGGGSNLSVGQRQIIALARAMVRASKLLILDEATSAIDYKTDAVIQTMLRSQLGSDITVITVAHRLQTIMDADKIMVLDSGKIVEFDSPKNLLKKEKGAFLAMVEGSGDKDSLLALAESKRY